MPPPLAPSQVFIKEDLRNILRGIIVTHESMRRMNPNEHPHFHAGFMAAIGAVETALDIRTGTDYTNLWRN